MGDVLINIRDKFKDWYSRLTRPQKISTIIVTSILLYAVIAAIVYTIELPVRTHDDELRKQAYLYLRNQQYDMLDNLLDKFYVHDEFLEKRLAQERSYQKAVECVHDKNYTAAYLLLKHVPNTIYDTQEYMYIIKKNLDWETLTELDKCEIP